VQLQRRHRVGDGHLVETDVVDLEGSPPRDQVHDLRRRRGEVVGLDQVLPCASDVHRLRPSDGGLLLTYASRTQLRMLSRSGRPCIRGDQALARRAWERRTRSALRTPTAAPSYRSWATPSSSDAEVRPDLSPSPSMASRKLFRQSLKSGCSPLHFGMMGGGMMLRYFLTLRRLHVTDSDRRTRRRVVTDSGRRTRRRRKQRRGDTRHSLHELITVHTGWCERLSRLP